MYLHIKKIDKFIQFNAFIVVAQCTTELSFSSGLYL